MNFTAYNNAQHITLSVTNQWILCRVREREYFIKNASCNKLFIFITLTIFFCCSSFGKYAYFICYQLKGASGVEAIKVAIDAGYRLFDTAFLYGNEDIVGEAIREKCVEGSTNREEITVISKLWSIHHDLVEKVETNVKLA